jgi:hypothetical protein
MKVLEQREQLLNDYCRNVCTISLKLCESCPLCYNAEYPEKIKPPPDEVEV